MRGAKPMSVDKAKGQYCVNYVRQRARLYLDFLRKNSNNERAILLLGFQDNDSKHPSLLDITCIPYREVVESNSPNLIAAVESYNRESSFVAWLLLEREKGQDPVWSDVITVHVEPRDSSNRGGSSPQHIASGGSKVYGGCTGTPEKVTYNNNPARRYSDPPSQRPIGVERGATLSSMIRTLDRRLSPPPTHSVEILPNEDSGLRREIASLLSSVEELHQLVEGTRRDIADQDTAMEQVQCMVQQEQENRSLLEEQLNALREELQSDVKEGNDATHDRLNAVDRVQQSLSAGLHKQEERVAALEASVEASLQAVMYSGSDAEHIAVELAEVHRAVQELADSQEVLRREATKQDEAMEQIHITIRREQKHRSGAINNIEEQISSLKDELKETNNAIHDQLQAVDKAVAVEHTTRHADNQLLTANLHKHGERVTALEASLEASLLCRSEEGLVEVHHVVQDLADSQKTLRELVEGTRRDAVKQNTVLEQVQCMVQQEQDNRGQLEKQLHTLRIAQEDRRTPIECDQGSVELQSALVAIEHRLNDVESEGKTVMLQQEQLVRHLQDELHATETQLVNLRTMMQEVAEEQRVWLEERTSQDLQRDVEQEEQKKLIHNLKGEVAVALQMEEEQQKRLQSVCESCVAEAVGGLEKRTKEDYNDHTERILALDEGFNQLQARGDLQGQSQRKQVERISALDEAVTQLRELVAANQKEAAVQRSTQAGEWDRQVNELALEAAEVQGRQDERVQALEVAVKGVREALECAVSEAVERDAAVRKDFQKMQPAVVVEEQQADLCRLVKELESNVKEANKVAQDRLQSQLEEQLSVLREEFQSSMQEADNVTQDRLQAQLEERLSVLREEFQSSMKEADNATCDQLQLENQLSALRSEFQCDLKETKNAIHDDRLQLKDQLSAFREEVQSDMKEANNATHDRLQAVDQAVTVEHTTRQADHQLLTTDLHKHGERVAALEASFEASLRAVMSRSGSDAERTAAELAEIHRAVQELTNSQEMLAQKPGRAGTPVLELEGNVVEVGKRLNAVEIAVQSLHGSQDELGKDLRALKERMQTCDEQARILTAGVKNNVDKYLQLQEKSEEMQKRWEQQHVTWDQETQKQLVSVTEQMEQGLEGLKKNLNNTTNTRHMEHSQSMEDMKQKVVEVQRQCDQVALTVGPIVNRLQQQIGETDIIALSTQLQELDAVRAAYPSASDIRTIVQQQQQLRSAVSQVKGLITVGTDTKEDLQKAIKHWEGELERRDESIEEVKRKLSRVMDTQPLPRLEHETVVGELQEALESLRGALTIQSTKLHEVSHSLAALVRDTLESVQERCQTLEHRIRASPVPSGPIPPRPNHRSHASSICSMATDGADSVTVGRSEEERESHQMWLLEAQAKMELEWDLREQQKQGLAVQREIEGEVKEVQISSEIPPIASEFDRRVSTPEHIPLAEGVTFKEHEEVGLLTTGVGKPRQRTPRRRAIGGLHGPLYEFQLNSQCEVDYASREEEMRRMLRCTLEPSQGVLRS